MEEPADTPNSNDEPWVLVATFRDLPQAHVARGTLEAAGLTVAVTDEYTVGADWLMSIAIGGVGLGVKASEEAAAREILAREAFDVDLAPELSDDLPEELRPDLSEEQAEREAQYFEERRWANRIRGAWGIFFLAPGLLPVMLVSWLWSKRRQEENERP